MKILDKIIISPTPPSSKNVAWFDGGSIKIQNKGKWENASESSSGGGIQIVDSEEKLNTLNVPVGSLAAVAVPGTSKESSFRDLYQPTEADIDTENMIIHTEKFSLVNSINVTLPTDTSAFPERPLMIMLAPRDFNMETNTKMLVITVNQNTCAAMLEPMTDDSGMFNLVDFTNGIINHDAVDAFNELLASDDWCYAGDTQDFLVTSEEYDIFDQVIKAVSGVSSTAEIYIKKDAWEQLHKKDLDKLARDLDKINTTAESKADKITITTYSSYKGLHPNVYTTYSISSTGSITIKLAAITDTTVYNEYILELKCTSTPSSVAFKNADGTEATIVWANGIAPIFVVGYTYLISIVNNLGVFAQYVNS